jgi:hypothetical protein
MGMIDYLDGHDKAIVLQKERSGIFLKEYHDMNEINPLFLREVLNKNDQIFKGLRSKVFPEKNLYMFSQQLFESYLGYEVPMMFVFVLASPTAIRELPSILNFMDIFYAFKTKPIFKFLFVEWPDLNGLKEQDLNKIQQNFNLLFEETHIVLKKHVKDPQIEILKYDFIVDYVSFSIDMFREDRIFQIDLNWIEHFYERENSYHKFCLGQAYFDLVIRRLVAIYMQDKMFYNYELSARNYLITTELNKRFLKCYRASCAILNILVKNPHV